MRTWPDESPHLRLKNALSVGLSASPLERTRRLNSSTPKEGLDSLCMEMNHGAGKRRLLSAMFRQRRTFSSTLPEICQAPKNLNYCSRRDEGRRVYRCQAQSFLSLRIGCGSKHAHYFSMKKVFAALGPITHSSYCIDTVATQKLILQVKKTCCSRYFSMVMSGRPDGVVS